MEQKRKKGRKPQEKLVLFPEVYTNTAKMTDAQFGVLMRAVFEYRFEGRIYEGDDLAVDVSFRTVAGQIDRYAEICKTNSNNAKPDGEDGATEISEILGNAAECPEGHQNATPIPNPIPDPSPNSSKGNTADKPPKPLRHKYGEYKNVLLSDEEFAKLQAEIPCWKEMIERLSSYMESSGKTYKNHLATMRNWYRKEQSTAKGKNPMPDYGGDENWSL